jgi:hypothetical protein
MNMAFLEDDYKAIPDSEEKHPTQDWLGSGALAPLRARSRMGRCG